jgi:hypothetical protein
MAIAPTKIASIRPSNQLNTQLTTHHRRRPLNHINRNTYFFDPIGDGVVLGTAQKSGDD